MLINLVIIYNVISILVSEPSVEPLIVKLEEASCLNKGLSGNLGSALAKLMQLKDLISGVIYILYFVILSLG